MYAVLAEESLIRHLLKRNIYIYILMVTKPGLPASMHTNPISISAFLSNITFHCQGTKWHHKWSHSFSVTGLTALWDFKAVKKVMGWCTTQWIMLLFSVKSIVKKTHFWTRKKTTTERKMFWPSGNFLIQYFFFAPLVMLFVVKTPEEER